MARAAIVAVRKLTAAAGHPIPAVSSASGTGGASAVLSLTALALISVACAGALLIVRHRRAANTGRRLDIAARPSSQAISQPRLLIAVTLIVGGVGWAIARGLNFYGLSLPDIAYGLDEPPLLLVLVGGWLLYRSRRR